MYMMNLNSHVQENVQERKCPMLCVLEYFSCYKNICSYIHIIVTFDQSEMSKYNIYVLCIINT